MTTLCQPDFIAVSIRDRLNGLSPDKFGGAWAKESRIQECSIGESDTFVSLHYLHKRPAVVVLCLKMLVRDTPCGVVVFSLPAPETSLRYGGKTWELARLYLLDEIPRNAESWLIGRSVRYIKRHRKDVKFLVSYADPDFNHSGVVYRASNWRPDGQTDSERKSPRVDAYNAATGERYGRASHVPTGAVVVTKSRSRKNRFVLPL